jgi:hypothetical protein
MLQFYIQFLIGRLGDVSGLMHEMVECKIQLAQVIIDVIFANSERSVKQ